MNVRWNNQFIVGNNTVDSQHKILFDLIDQFESAIETKDNSEQLRILDAFIDYTKYHFSEEETNFDEESYDDYNVHLLEHRYFEKRILQAKELIDNSTQDIQYEILEFLNKWLSHHVLNVDMKFFKSK